MRLSLTALGLFSILILCPPALCLDTPWGTVDESAGVWDSIYGDFSGFPVTVGDWAGAFRVSDDTLIGGIEVTSDDSYPLMAVWGLLGTEVYFKVWDTNLGVDYWAFPNYTVQNPGSPPPLSYQHDLENEGPVPEPPTFVILGLSLALVTYFYLKRFHRPRVYSTERH